MRRGGCCVHTCAPRRAEEEGLRPVPYRQSLQTFDLPRRYHTILVSCGTIQLVIPLADVWESLRRLYAHLEPGGLLVLTSFNRYHELERETPGVWKFRARKALPDGTELEKQARVESRNLLEQTLTQTVRYLRLKDRRVIEEQRCEAPERWYFKHELILMLEQVGFRDVRVTGGYTMEPAHDGHDVMTFFATRPAD